MAEIIPLDFDSFPLSMVDISTPQKTQAMRDDYRLAKNVMLFCQTQCLLALRGEMTNEDRFKLKYAMAMIKNEATLG